MRRFAPTVVLLVATIGAGFSLFSASAAACGRPCLSDVEAAAVDRAVRAEMQRQQAVGVAIGVIRGGRIAYSHGYGFEDREARIPVTSKTLFRWASISKTLTAVAAMQLAERGLLDLDADVRCYVPEFPDKGQPITPRQLLCHQGGIVHYDGRRVIVTRRAYDAPHPFENVVTALDRFKESSLVAAPGTKFHYSTHGFMLLAAVVQRAGREKFANQIRRRIAEPLGLRTLQPDYQWKAIPHRAIGYRKLGKKSRIVRSVDADVSWKLGGGGFLSNVDDMTRWAAGLINGCVVCPCTEAAMWTPQRTSTGKTTPLGLGFFIRQTDGSLEVSHGGAQEKTRTQLTIWPREGRGVVVMCNSEYAKPKRFVAAIERALAEEPASWRKGVGSLCSPEIFWLATIVCEQRLPTPFLPMTMVALPAPGPTPAGNTSAERSKLLLAVEPARRFLTVIPQRRAGTAANTFRAEHSIRLKCYSNRLSAR